MRLLIARLVLGFLILIIPITVTAFLAWLIRDVSIVVLGQSLPVWACFGGAAVLAFGWLAWWTWEDLSRGIKEEFALRKRRALEDEDE